MAAFSEGPRLAATPTLSTRLAFLESLLVCDAVGAVAELAVARASEGQRVLVALVVEGRLVGVAASGFERDAIAIPLADRDAPLVQALAATEPFSLVLEGAACTAHRLSPARGLVIVDAPRLDAELAWTFEHAAKKLGDLQRRASERALAQSILESLPDPALVTDGEGRIVLANPRARLYFSDKAGRNHEQLLGALAHAAEGHEPSELPLLDPADDSDRLFELHSASIAMPDGAGTMSVLRNVTDLQLAVQEIDDNYRRLRLANAEIQAERDRLDLVIDSVADPIIVTDADGATVMMNRPAERLFIAAPSAPAEEAERIRGNDAHFAAHIGNLLFVEPDGRFRGELRLVDPVSARPVPVEALSGRVLSDQGQITAVVTILHDLTQQSLLEQKVRAATEELVERNELLQRQALAVEAASSAKSQFLANMSHELRTPLNAILGYTSMLLQGVSGPLTPGVERPLQRVESNGKQLLVIINDVLDIAKIEAGKMPLHVTKFGVAELVKEVLAELEPLILKSKLAVSAELGESLAPLKTDRPKIKQILSNLIANALKFTPKGTVVVSAQFHKRKGETWLSVADTGIGIAPKDQESVFQDFRQVDSSPTRQYGGTGLGLAICRRLAHVLGGELRLASRENQGSTFTFVLPARAAAR